MAHEAAATKRLHGLHLRFATKSWSDAFECPVCGATKRYNLNFLGARIPTCDGSGKFRLVPKSICGGGGAP